MMPAPQTQMYQQQAQPMPMHQANMMQPMHHQPSNKGWILAGGVHIILMISLLILSIVTALFEPAPDWVEDDGFGTQLFYAMLDGTIYLAFAGYAITLISLMMALNVNCNKALAIVLPAVSHIITILLWSLIAASLYPDPDADFSDAWEDVFGEDFFEIVIPTLISHIALCAGIIALQTMSSNE